MKDLVARVQRELPDTDRDRYDIAYERGHAQARSKLLLGGLAVGSALGAGVMWLLDPERGKTRRAQLASRTEGLRNDLARTAEGRGKDLRNRLQGFAIERGIMEPPGGRDGGTGGGGGTGGATGGPGTANYGDGYREGFGQTEHDPLAPGSQVTDPIRDEEVVAYGSSGPVAGTTMTYDETKSPDRTS